MVGITGYYSKIQKGPGPPVQDVGGHRWLHLGATEPPCSGPAEMQFDARAALAQNPSFLIRTAVSNSVTKNRDRPGIHSTRGHFMLGAALEIRDMRIRSVGRSDPDGDRGRRRSDFLRMWDLRLEEISSVPDLTVHSHSVAEVCDGLLTLEIWTRAAPRGHNVDNWVRSCNSGSLLTRSPCRRGKFARVPTGSHRAFNNRRGDLRQLETGPSHGQVFSPPNRMSIFRTVHQSHPMNPNQRKWSPNRATPIWPS